MSRPHYAPPDFTIGGEDFVFVKFHAARHVIEIDAANRCAAARSEIDFESFAPGFPLFDLDRSARAWIDGDATALREQMSPDDVTCYRTVGAPVTAGLHRLHVEQDARWVGFANDGVDFFFSFLDRSAERRGDPTERFFLERYLPANLEFDRHPMQLEVRLDRADRHRLLTNGAASVRREGDGWTVVFPDWFCSSSPLICLVPAARISERRFLHQRNDGTAIAVEVVGRAGEGAAVDDCCGDVEVVLDELEQRIAPFPFERYLVLVGGDGGMEYAGGCLANAANLRHETIHNYFGRCLAPVDGNAGWVDEAIAAWLDGDRSQGHPIGQNLGRRSPYERATASGAWQLGARVLDVLDADLASAGGFECFLRWWFDQRHHQQFTAASFQEDLETFAGRSLQKQFDEMVYSDDD